MKKLGVLVVVLLGVAFTLWTSVPSGEAIGLKVAPLLYSETLAPHEKKKGFVDISNPNDTDSTFTTEVSGFKQINDNGDLGFFDEPAYKNGIRFDYDQFTLGPRESLRLYFLLDADKLPNGGVYAALFFKTTDPAPSPDSTSIQPATRVGTLLVIDNGGGGVRQANITSIEAPFFQFGDRITATASVENSGGESAIAFFPTLQFRFQPFGGSGDQQAPLAFPGITRTSSLEAVGSYFGLVRIKVSTGDHTSAKWVFAVTGKAKLALFVVLLTILGSVVFVIYRGKHKHHRKQGR